MTEDQEAKLIVLTQADPLYRQLLSACEALTPDYRRILHGLPQADRELLETYIALCEELEYRRSCLAAMLPKQTATPRPYAEPKQIDKAYHVMAMRAWGFSRGRLSLVTFLCGHKKVTHSDDGALRTNASHP